MSSAENEFAIILSQHRPRIERWLLRKQIPPSDVPDLAQTIVLRAYERRHLYDPSKSLVGWLHRIMRNAVSDYWAKLGVEEAAKAQLVKEDAAPSNPEKDTNDLEIDQLVAKVIDALPPKRRDLLRARFVDDLSMQEIAESFDMPIATVKSTIARTLDTCRRALLSKGIKDANRALAPLVWEGHEDVGGEEELDTTDEAPCSELVPRGTGKAAGHEGRARTLRARLRTFIPDAAVGGLIVYLLMRGIAALHLPAPVTLAPTVEGRSATLTAAAILEVASHPAPCPQALPLPAPPLAAPVLTSPPDVAVNPRTRARVRGQAEANERKERKQDTPSSPEGPHA